MEFHLATKKNDILSFPGKWMDLQNIILNKVHQAQKAKSHMSSLLYANATMYPYPAK
jgi:hypothetical protein